METIRYLIIGIITTILNFFCDFLLRRIGISYMISIPIAWIISVSFAYFGNKNFVFKSGGNLYIKFVLGRISTLILEWCLSYVLLFLLKLNPLIVKIFIQVLIIILNYIIGKVIFDKE